MLYSSVVPKARYRSSYRSAVNKDILRAFEASESRCPDDQFSENRRFRSCRPMTSHQQPPIQQSSRWAKTGGWRDFDEARDTTICTPEQACYSSGLSAHKLYVVVARLWLLLWVTKGCRKESEENFYLASATRRGSDWLSLRNYISVPRPASSFLYSYCFRPTIYSYDFGLSVPSSDNNKLWQTCALCCAANGWRDA